MSGLISSSSPGAPTTAGTFNVTVTAEDPGVFGSASFTWTIIPASPTITTGRDQTSATVGLPISDRATLSDAANPTGTVTFKLYDNPNGTGTPLYTDTESVTGAGSGGIANSGAYTTLATGTDYWVATYNGDRNNNKVTSGAAAEPVTITAATPKMFTTLQPASATVGSSIADQATVYDGVNPTGTVTFNLYSSATTQDASTLLFTDTETASTTGSSQAMATSKGYTATATGTDYWVATYNGDSNNNSVTSGPGDEPVTILAIPTITTSEQPATATVGGSIADQATVSGGDSPTGTVTFSLYNNSNGTGTPLFTDTKTLSGGMATSKGYTAAATGTDYWVATYNGDSNNAPVTSDTGSEPVTISPATPTISTSQQPATATVGGLIADQATVTGGYNPTGTVTFNLYNNPNGTGTPLFTDTKTLSGGMATSKGYTAAATGTDYWVATYNGDSNNNTVTSGIASESVVIGLASPGINTSPQPASVTVGGSIADKATVTGGYNPTGTVTFNLYNSKTVQNASTLLFTDTETASISGSTVTATSKGYTATAAGTDYWVATYNGDSNNSSVTSGPGDEPVTLQYRVALLYKPPLAANAGKTVPIKLELQKYVNGALVNASSASLGVQALCVVPAGKPDCTGAVINYAPPQAFTFMSGLDTGGGYQFNVKTPATLAKGIYQLLFRASGEPSTTFHAEAGATFSIG
jgi:hypothetical protein